MRDSQLTRIHAEDLFERLKTFTVFHPETPSESVIDIIELHMLRAQLNVNGNVPDED